MTVVKPKSITNICHILYIVGHTVPELWAVLRSPSIVKSDVVPPDFNVPSHEVMSHLHEIVHDIPLSENVAIESSNSFLLISEFNEIPLDYWILLGDN